MRLLLVIATAALLSACATQHKTYMPPSDAKVTASTKKVTDGATKAHSAAREAKQHVEEAQKHADAIAVGSMDVQKKLDEIIKLAPAELQPALAAVKADVLEMQGHEEQLHSELVAARATQDQLELHQTTLDIDIIQLKTNQTTYHTDAVELAVNATDEREARIKVETKLSWYRWHFWLTWIIAGAGLVMCALLAFLKFTGRLALSAGAIAAKMP